MSFPKKIISLLENRKQQGIYRQLTTESGRIDFCSNDYLGFARSPELVKLRSEIKTEGNTIKNGSTGSRLISGNSRYTEELEKKLAAYHHAEAALIFNSGYDANIGLLSSVPQKNDLVLLDELSHASIYDGIRLSFAKHYKFRHNDAAHLKELIDRLSGSVENIYIVVESVYSMDGDCAPLREITAQLTPQCFLIVDEAHATGVFGKKGEGLCNEPGLEQKCFARIITFGKAIGAHGAMVAGSEVLRNYLINFARSFIYTTALPQESLKTIEAAYQLLAQGGQQHELKKKISLFKELCSGAKNLIPSSSAIQCFLIAGNSTAEEKAQQLQDAGFELKAIKSPTVAEGKERIRICLHSFNSDDDIKKLTEALKTFDIMKS